MGTLRRLIVVALGTAAIVGCGTAVHRGGDSTAVAEPQTLDVVCHDGIGTQYHPHATRLPTLGPRPRGSHTPAQIDMSRLPNGKFVIRCVG